MNDTIPAYGPAPRSRPAAEAIAWSWRARAQADTDAAGKRAAALQRKGAIQAAIGLTIAAVLYGLGHPTIATIAATLATLTLVLALLSPTFAFAALERGLARLGGWIGTVVTWLVMLPIFLLFFVPFGLLFRRGDKDRMQRGLDPRATTYWRRRDDALGGERHLTQF